MVLIFKFFNRVPEIVIQPESFSALGKIAGA